MNNIPYDPIARGAALLTLTLCALGVNAAVTTYTSSSSFLAAASSTNLASFDDLAVGSYGQTLSTNGINIVSLTGGNSFHDVYVEAPSTSNFAVPSNTHVLDANGDENFKFKLVSGSVFTAIGFDFYANRYGAPSFSFYDNSSVLVTTISVAQSPSTLGFIGFTSTTPIAYITTTVDRGYIQNTGYDNLRIGSINAVPEPQAAWLLIGGLVAVAGVACRRSA